MPKGPSFRVLCDQVARLRAVLHERNPSLAPPEPITDRQYSRRELEAELNRLLAELGSPATPSEGQQGPHDGRPTSRIDAVTPSGPYYIDGNGRAWPVGGGGGGVYANPAPPAQAAGIPEWYVRDLLNRNSRLEDRVVAAPVAASNDSLSDKLVHALMERVLAPPPPPVDALTEADKVLQLGDRLAKQQGTMWQAVFNNGPAMLESVAGAVAKGVAGVRGGKLRVVPDDGALPAPADGEGGEADPEPEHAAGEEDEDLDSESLSKVRDFLGQFSPSGLADVIQKAYPGDIVAFRDALPTGEAPAVEPDSSEGG